ncbi:hypothetical protein DFS33DRAFT_1272038 [Desarmillaria ectypa]|nr:hypothetical protein DFS33DRAFT_1272038 [Desarmillaria ectypa]
MQSDKWRRLSWTSTSRRCVLHLWSTCQEQLPALSGPPLASKAGQCRRTEDFHPGTDLENDSDRVRASWPTQDQGPDCQQEDLGGSNGFFGSSSHKARAARTHQAIPRIHLFDENTKQIFTPSQLALKGVDEDSYHHEQGRNKPDSDMNPDPLSHTLHGWILAPE